MEGFPFFKWGVRVAKFSEKQPVLALVRFSLSCFLRIFLKTS